jgi:tRNA G18 (ribose-2'-O)-methylase SpoU
VAEVQTAIGELKKEGYAIWAVEQVEGSTPLQCFQVTQGTKLALVLGNEVEGVSDGVLGLCDGALEVPQFGSKHSLNVAVCAGIVVWEVFRKWKFA